MSDSRPAAAVGKRLWRSEELAIAAICFLFLLVLSGVVVWRYGSVAGVLARLAGRSLLPDASSKSLGEIPAGSVSTISFALRNLTGHPIRIQGSSTSCTCSKVEGVPFVIAPHESRAVTANVGAGSRPEPFQGSLTLFTDDGQEPKVVLGYSGRVNSVLTDASH